MGEYVGVLKDISAIDLGAVAARGALEATGVTPEEIDHTVIGNALQTSGDAIYGARHVALKAGVPFERPALTVNRLCGSGIQSIVSGAQMIQHRRREPPHHGCTPATLRHHAPLEAQNGLSDDGDRRIVLHCFPEASARALRPPGCDALTWCCRACKRRRAARHQTGVPPAVPLKADALCP